MEALAQQPGIYCASTLPAEVIESYGSAEGPQPEAVRYDAAVVLPDGVALPEGLLEDRVPGGRYARAVYIGPYEGLGAAWESFTGEWLPNSSERVGRGVCIEIYRDQAPWGGQERPRTELYIPLA